MKVNGQSQLHESWVQVDRFMGRDHLFKRSVILVKAWCYYESRVLGAPHGLISTYALETLVLYIFHVFHSSLSGPVQVGVSTPLPLAQALAPVGGRNL